MKKPENKKLAWIKPEVLILDIKKDTFSGNSYGGGESPGKIGGTRMPAKI